MPTVLFVCTANRARSPVAAALFSRELQRRDAQGDWQVLSAGTWTTDGVPATPDAAAAARRLGIELEGHRSSQITAGAISGSDLILVMEQGQKEALALEFPASSGRLHLLTEVAAGVEYNIPDPGLSPAVSDVYDEIAELIQVGFDRLSALATRNSRS